MQGIIFSPSELRLAIEKMNGLNADELSSIKAIAVQAELEVAIRKLLVSRPNDIYAGEKAKEYLTTLRGVPPPDCLIKFISRKNRFLRLTEDQRIALEREQCGRCAWCGAVLSSAANPNVDHKFPIAFGGEDVFENCQILCARCNSGKGDLVHWVMGAPWFANRGGEISERLRYCVLGRYRSKCFEQGCHSTSLDEELHVDLVIPRSMGGSPIFDNLAPFCSEHKVLRQQRNLEKSRSSVRRLRVQAIKTLLPLRR